jgi:hypothetical protein
VSVLDLPHIGFVIAAYAAGLVVVALLIGVTFWEHVSLRRSLVAYEGKSTVSHEAGDATR